jgi:hypothetical protein
MTTKIQLTLTYYNTQKDYENGTAMIEPYDPNDPKEIKIIFIKYGTTWILQQPPHTYECRISRISHPEIILSQLNEKCDDGNFANTLKIQRSVYPSFDEFVYEEPYEATNGYVLK